MKATRSVSVILSALAVGMGAGWWLREANAVTPGAAHSPARKAITNQPVADVATPPDSPDTSSVSLPEWDPARTGEENELAMYAALEHVPAARIAEWLRKEYRLPAEYASGRTFRAWRATRAALLDRLREKDPAAFAAWVTGMPADSTEARWITDAAEAIRKHAGPEAEAALAKLKAAHPNLWRWEELRRLSESDPEAGLAMAAESARHGLPGPCAALLTADPERALAFVRDHPSLLKDVAAAFLKLGPEALESFAEKCPGGADATRAVWQMVAEDKARRGDGKAFAAFLLAHPDIKETSAHLLTAADPAAADEAVRALAGAPAMRERVLAALATRDPARAARLFAESPDAAAMLSVTGARFGMDESFLKFLSRSWLARDPAAFRAWTLTLPDELQAKMLPEAASGLGGAEFLDFTRGVRLTESSAVHELARRAAQSAPDTAALVSWLSGFPEADRERLTGSVTATLAALDLAAATELTVNHPDLQRRENMIQSVANSARFPDLHAAAAWGNSLPGDLRVDALFTALDSTAERAGGWDATLGRTAAEVIAASPPESASVWELFADKVAHDIGRKSLGEAAAFLAALPEAARGQAEQRMADNLATAMMEAPERLESLERVADPGVRRAVAERFLHSTPVIRSLSAAQNAELTGRLKTLTAEPRVP